MKTFTSLAAVASLTALAAAQSSSTTASATSAAAAPTEVTDCHFHGDTPYCFAGEDEWEVDDDLDEDSLPDAYTDCHTHGADELHCSSPEDTTLYAATAEAEDSHSNSDSDHSHDHSHDESSSSNSTAIDEITAVSGCHAHDDTVYCFVGEDEWEVESDIDAANAPEEFTDCHAHGEELHCVSPEDVTLTATTEHSEEHEDGEAEDHTHSTNESGETTTEEASGENLASTAQISSALVMVGAAVVAVCIF